ncbi:MAG: hypothetical protein HOA17_05015 [Candidatus Melainabacteria bacterium]|jgi:hypothetical protein|nr:hypothetical protein [Candidatus Melainabacteria bacterium]
MLIKQNCGLVLILLILRVVGSRVDAFELSWSKNKSDYFKLALPLNYSLNQDCFVLYYPDRIAESDYSDYRCGKLSFDNKRATVFAAETGATGQAIEVLSAADGLVTDIVLAEAKSGRN